MRRGRVRHLVVAALIGCATGTTTVVTPPQSSLASYQVAEVPDLEGIGPDPPWPASPTVPTKVRAGIADTVAWNLRESELFARVARSSGARVESVLLLKGQVIEYETGSRYLRHEMFPFGSESGQASIIIRVKFIEKNSNRLLAECDFEGVVRGGPMGGSFTEAYAQIGQQIVQFIKQSASPP